MEKMMEMIIHKYGFENENTILFFRECEKPHSVIYIKILFLILMEGMQDA